MLALASVITTGLFGIGATSALASYGAGEQYQIELSSNISGPQGGGVWLWMALNSNHTGDYSGSDCGHGGAGAASDKGDLTWSQSASGGSIVISGVRLNGLAWPTTITVPAKYGHYTGTIGTFMTLPPFVPGTIGTTQLQVAP